MTELPGGSPVRVAFELPGRTAEVLVRPGVTLLEAARSAGVLLAATCGGRGTCGTCAVEVVEGELARADDAETAGLRRARPGMRFACRARVTGPVTVRPVIRVPQPETAAPGGAALPGRGAFGVDLGTTTVAARLAGRAAGGSEAFVVNPQAAFGADVASRLSAAASGEAAPLQSAAVRAVEEAVALACERSGCPGPQRLVVAANTVMAHLFLGADTATLGASPHAAAYEGLVRARSAELGSRFDAEVVVLPHMGGFVGGDAVAGALALGLDEADEPVLMLDLGTNAEVVLGSAGSLTAASAAAGPAFEGAGIECGGPAAEGAVVGVALAEGSLRLDVAGGGQPMWLAGSGIVDLLAALLSAGHLAPDGLLVPEGPLAGRFHRRERDVLAFQVAGETGAPGDVCFTQLDVRELQLAKAAVAVAVRAVLGAAGVTWGDLAAVHLAGAFGAALKPASLAALGLVPASPRRVSFAGDAALEGATLVAGDAALEERAVELSARARVLDLAAGAGFRERLLASLELSPLP